MPIVLVLLASVVIAFVLTQMLNDDRPANPKKRRRRA